MNILGTLPELPEQSTGNQLIKTKTISKHHGYLSGLGAGAKQKFTTR